MQHRKLGKEIRRLDNLIMRQIHRETSPAESLVVSGNNGRILRFLSEHQDREIYQKDLEEEFGITRSTASRVLGLMEQNGLICRESVPHDARLKKLVLTDQSRQMNEQPPPGQLQPGQRGKAMDARLLRGFTPDEERQLYAFLDRVRQNIEE